MALLCKANGTLIACTVISEDADKWIVKLLDTKGKLILDKDVTRHIIFEGIFTMEAVRNWYIDNPNIPSEIKKSILECL